jgi:hypothetical protein
MQAEKKQKYFINQQSRLTIESPSSSTTNLLSKIEKRIKDQGIIEAIDKKISIIEVGSDKIWIPMYILPFSTDEEINSLRAELKNNAECIDKNKSNKIENLTKAISAKNIQEQIIEEKQNEGNDCGFYIHFHNDTVPTNEQIGRAAFYSRMDGNISFEEALDMVMKHEPGNLEMMFSYDEDMAKCVEPKTNLHQVLKSLVFSDGETKPNKNNIQDRLKNFAVQIQKCEKEQEVKISKTIQKSMSQKSLDKEPNCECLIY